MKKIQLLLVAFLLPCLSVCSGDNSVDAGLVWLTDFEQAKVQSAETGLPIFAYFTGSDWCGYCTQLNRAVLSRPEFHEYASENLILLELDFPRRTPQPRDIQQKNQALAKRYGVQGFPAIFILDKDGNEIARTGYQKLEAKYFIEHLKRIQNPEKYNEGLNWIPDIETAKTIAAEKGVPIFVLFTAASWEPNSMRLSNEILSSEEFRTYAEKNLVLLKVAFPKSGNIPPHIMQARQDLARQYQVRNVPTAVILNRNGGELARVDGYPPEMRTTYVDHLKSLIE